MSTQSPTSFPLFGNLPFEIRIRIWELSLPGPRVVLLLETAKSHIKSSELKSRIRKYEVLQLEKKQWRQEAAQELRLYGDARLDGLLGYLELDVEFRTPDRAYGTALADEGGDDDGDEPGDEVEDDDEDEDGESPGDHGSYGNGYYDSHIQDLWVRSPAQTYSSVQTHLQRQIPSQSVGEFGSEAYKSEWCLRSTCPPPPLVYTCRESALVASGRYQNSLHFNKDTAYSQVYFDFERDTLYLDSRTFLEKYESDMTFGMFTLSRYDLRSFDRMSLAGVKHLALDWDDWYGFERRLSWILGYFPSLEELVMVVNDSELQFDPSNLVFVPLGNIGYALQEYEKDAEQIFEDRRSSLGRYSKLFSLHAFIKHINKEMSRRLARSNRSWQVPRITLQTLVDMDMMERLDKAEEKFENEFKAYHIREYGVDVDIIRQHKESRTGIFRRRHA